LSRTPISRDAFRRACSRFATGVAVATVLDRDGKPHGLTINSFTSVSADPPLVLICLDQSCSLLTHFSGSGHYALSFLSEEQQELSNRFAALPEGRFQGVTWKPGPATGMPILDGSIGFMECSVHQQIVAGDHTLFIGHIEDCGGQPEARPLLYYASAYQKIR